ncbi:M91 family zinc metallopeptidase [Microbulbifer variabilis]|uniref:M91 family zinc metallopeptidase n=1 Tax=Microbulbifer variabilis TaxID=266805 RepID=UPI001CFE1EE9|nr:M91 family zinc metallopeptidase [Microbulbifer variabilis]
MGLCIDSTNLAFINQVRNALTTLLGQANALTYSSEKYHTGARTIIRITRGVGMTNALLQLPQSATLVSRIIASPHDTRITESTGLAAVPDKWLKDRVWSNFKYYVPLVKHDQGFMGKVMSTGASACVHWNNAVQTTTNLNQNGTVTDGGACPNFITLAHELGHADRINRGAYLSGGTEITCLVDERQNMLHNVQVTQPTRFFRARVNAGGANIIIPDLNRTINNPNNVITTRTQGWIWVTTERILLEELANVGGLSDDNNVLPNDPLTISENTIRVEHGIARRRKYGRIGQIN